MISLFFNARQKDIKNGSCKWSPCSQTILVACDYEESDDDNDDVDSPNGD